MTDTKPTAPAAALSWTEIGTGGFIACATLALLPMVWQALHLHTPTEFLTLLGVWGRPWLAVASTVITLLVATLAIQILTRGLITNALGLLPTLLIIGMVLYAVIVIAFIVMGTPEERAVLAQQLMSGWLGSIKRFFV